MTRCLQLTLALLVGLMTGCTSNVQTVSGITDEAWLTLSHKPDADYYQAWYQRRWIGIGRVFLPLTVAFDIVTAPIQIPVFIYMLHNMQWF